MKKPKQLYVRLVDEKHARRVAWIIGESGSHHQALAELERRRAAGERLLLCEPVGFPPMLLIVPVEDLDWEAAGIARRAPAKAEGEMDGD